MADPAMTSHQEVIMFRRLLTTAVAALTLTFVNVGVSMVGAPAPAANAAISSSVTASFPIVRPSDNNNLVRIVQLALGDYGYSLTADGVYGSGTLAAVKAFQGSRGLTKDGVVGQNTWAALLKPLDTNSSGAMVKALQAGLGVDVDGVYGAGTDAAVIRVQWATGQAQDNLVGSNTWAAVVGARAYVHGVGPNQLYRSRWHDYAVNGYMPAGELCGIAQNSSWKFACRGVRDFNAMDAAFKAKFGHVMPVTYWAPSLYRTYAQQVTAYNNYLNGTGNLAAKPGTSNHGWGLAADISTSIMSATESSWLGANAANWGFVRDVSGEPWHYHYIR